MLRMLAVNRVTSRKFIFGALLAIPCLLSLTYSVYFQIEPSVDARAYDMIAQNIVSGNGYREALSGPLYDDNAILRVGPGFEVFLAVIFFIFGHHYSAVWVAHALLHALTTLLVFLTARKIFYAHQQRDSIGFIAALFVGLSPDLITMTGMLMSETLGVFLIALTSYLFFRIVREEKNSNGEVCLLGIAFGMAALVRTPAMLLAVPIVIFFVWKKKGVQAVLFCVVAFLVFSPWIIRNYRVYQTFVPTNLAYGIDLAAGNHLGASGELEPYPRNDEVIARYGKIAGTRMLAGEAVSFIASNPLEFFRITANRISIYFSFARPTGFWFHLSGITRAFTLVLSALYAAALFTFGFLGTWFYRRRRQVYGETARWLFYMAVMIALGGIFIIVETRYRFLIYPLFSIFAALGIYACIGRALPRRILYVIPMVLFLNTALDVYRNIDRILERITLL